MQRALPPPPRVLLRFAACARSSVLRILCCDFAQHDLQIDHILRGTTAEHPMEMRQLGAHRLTQKATERQGLPLLASKQARKHASTQALTDM
eukprot:COSAG06_NODE_72_length_25897_cov_9.227382_8_plen_92_part_00